MSFGVVFCAVPVTNFSLLEKRVLGKTGLSSNSEAQQISGQFFLLLFYYLLFYRLPDKEEEQLELYEKDKGSAQIHGQIFEYKFCALLYLGPETRGISLNLLLT